MLEQISIKGRKGIMNQEQLLEEQHLEECKSIIRENIRQYEKQAETYKKEITELFQEVRRGEGDSYGRLIAEQNILEHTQNSLRKNRVALKKAYFGRIDYMDKTFNEEESYYIGKNGITKDRTDVIIVDWRAPVSSVYYENELGNGSYNVPESNPISINLKKKRTYDISDGTLLGFYDDDVAANDELLVKYLSQNKEAILGDIIATIQKEQNEIIRDAPFKNIIVQGVAGSGKTTVALHRISYLLYNYEDRYKPSEFCIVGSSDMLLHYISSGLPELDVNHVSQMRMDRFIPYLMGKAWKKKYTLIPDQIEAPIKSKLAFVKNLEQFLSDWNAHYLPIDEIRDPQIGLIFSASNMEETKKANSHLSLFQLEKLYNNRISSRIKFLCSEEEASTKKAFLQKYKNYFHLSNYHWTEIGVYTDFLNWLEQESNFSFSDTKHSISKGKFDIYDAAAIGLIWRRIFQKKETDEFSQIIIDEAQDFGEMVYYVLKALTPDCYFTIMGDVSQNIRYETGMNDWEGLKEALFETENDSFYLLSKSYRNTIEISEYAGKVLKKTSQESYRIQPVIRHGKEVSIFTVNPHQLNDLLIQTVTQIQKKEFETIAVICRNDSDAQEVRHILGIQDQTQNAFHNGIMVLPVYQTKGLEFDCVILWKPDQIHYGENPREAKLLYVAITRALHELYLIGDNELSPLFNESKISNSL